MTVVEIPVPPQPGSPVELGELAKPVLDETGQVLMRAADIIRKNGWAGPGVWGNPGTPRCIMGAIQEASPDGMVIPLSVQGRIAESLGVERAVGPVYWNNAEGRTEEQVIEALERAAIGA